MHLQVGQVEWLFAISCAMKMDFPIQKGLLSTEIPVSAIEKVMLKLQSSFRPQKLQESETLTKAKRLPYR